MPKVLLPARPAPPSSKHSLSSAPNYRTDCAYRSLLHHAVEAGTRTCQKVEGEREQGARDDARQRNTPHLDTIPIPLMSFRDKEPDATKIFTTLTVCPCIREMQQRAPLAGRAILGWILILMRWLRAQGNSHHTTGELRTPVFVLWLRSGLRSY
jgi:hypothetical protein